MTYGKVEEPLRVVGKKSQAIKLCSSRLELSNELRVASLVDSHCWTDKDREKEANGQRKEGEHVEVGLCFTAKLVLCCTDVLLGLAGVIQRSWIVAESFLVLL